MIELRERHADVTPSDFAEAIQIPLGTLADWMRTTPLDDPTVDGANDPLDEHAGDDATSPRPTAAHAAKHAQIEAVLAAWRTWRGDFGARCRHVHRERIALVAELTIELVPGLPARRLAIQ